MSDAAPACRVALVHQDSRAACVEGRSFGCYGGDGQTRPTVWVRGCRGSFRCELPSTGGGGGGDATNPSVIECGFPPGAASYQCHCDGRRATASRKNSTDGRLAVELPRQHDRGSYLVAIGVMTAPRNFDRRAWMRKHVPAPPELLMRFVLGRSSGPTDMLCAAHTPAAPASTALLTGIG